MIPRRGEIYQNIHTGELTTILGYSFPWVQHVSEKDGYTSHTHWKQFRLHWNATHNDKERT